MFKGTVLGLFWGLFRTDFCVVRTEQSGLIEGLVGRVLASGVVQFGGEVATIGRIHHVNVVALVGFCI